MLKELGELAPMELLVGLAVWGGLSYGITSETIAMRIAHADHIPQCEKAAAADIRGSLQNSLAATGGLSQEERAAPIIDEKMNQMRTFAPDHMRLLDMLGVGQAMEMQKQAARAARRQRESVQAEMKRRADAAIARAPDRCSCQARAAYEEGRTGWTLFTATFGLIEPSAVEGFPAVMSSKAPLCAGKALS